MSMHGTMLPNQVSLTIYPSSTTPAPTTWYSNPVARILTGELLGRLDGSSWCFFVHCNSGSIANSCEKVHLNVLSTPFRSMAPKDTCFLSSKLQFGSPQDLKSLAPILKLTHSTSRRRNAQGVSSCNYRYTVRRHPMGDLSC